MQPFSCSTGAVPAQAKILDLLAYPACGSALEMTGQEVACDKCLKRFPIEDGIPLLFHPHTAMDPGADVTQTVKAFYEDNPFPNYDEPRFAR